MREDDPTYVPGSCSRKGQPKTQDAPDLECATPELTQGYRILQALTRISRYFLELPDHTQKGMRDYYDVISKPVCFKEIQQKFAGGEYKKISEFVKDVRCLLLNCYTYFGPNDIHTQKALRVEQVLKQRIALLPEDLRTVCSLEDENAQTVTSAEGVQSQLLQSVIGERSRREIERKQRLLEELRKEKEGKERDLGLWEQERLLTGTDREKMESMSELAVIGNFVALLLEELNITTISMFEVERMVFMPQASKSLSVLMTTLLSAPQRRSKLHTKPPMPYRTWTKKLALKVSDWYKTYIKSDKNANFMFEKFGIEHQFWKILGTWNPLEEYEFHELTVYQRVILIKAVCDYILQNHKILRDTIAEKRHEFGKCLGEDRSGAKFFYFPQLLDQCIRIYRQAPEPKSWMDRDLEYTKLLAEKCNGSSTLHGKRRGRKPKNRGEIAKEKNHSDIAITRKSLRNTPKPVEISVSVLGSSSNQANECSNCGTTGYESEAPSNKSGLEVLGNENSSPQTGHSASSINENLSEETQHESSISTSCGIVTHLGNEPNSSHTSVSEDVYTAYKVSHHNKCSSECSDSVSSCNLGTKHACDGDRHSTLRPLMVENKNSFTVDQSECVNVQNMPSYQTQNTQMDSNTIIKVSKTRRPLYNPHWLEPNPDDFRLVVDTVEGVRQLQTKYHDDDSVEMSRQSNNKSGKACRPLCEVKLVRQLSSLLSDLGCVEIKILLNTRSACEKLYKEWVEFNNRPTDYVDPDEAFWNNEKEPAETSECQTPETHLAQTSAVLEDTELPQTPQVTDPGDTAEDTLQTCGSGMKLRRRTAQKEKYDGLDISDVSSDVHSDDSDNWVVSKSRKIRPKKRKRINNPVLHNSSKKKGALEECPQQPPLNQEETFPKMVQGSTSKIKMQNDVEKSPAKKRRVRKNIFPSNEACSSEPSHQLQREKKCRKPVNSATNKSSDIAVSGTLRDMLSVSQTSKFTARDVKTKELLPLQSHKVGDVNRTVKNVEKDCVIIDAVDLEMENIESLESVTQNVEVQVQAGKPSSQNFVDASEKPKQTHGQETVPGPACISSCKKSHKITNKHVCVKKSDTRENVKQATEFPALTPHSSHVSKTHAVIKSQSITATNCPSGSNSNIDYEAPSRCVHQGQKNKTVRQSLGNVQAEPDVICISDNSDDEIELLCSKYNPKLDYQLERKIQALKKEGQSAVNTKGDLTPKQMNNSPESGPCVQRNIPTCGMEAASSTGSSVNARPNQPQTRITNPNNSITYLEEGFPVDNINVGIHTATENQHSMNEAVLSVQPSGSSHSVLGDSMLQTESVEHVQRHIPGQSTANTVISLLPLSSPQNNPNIPVHHSVAAGETITSVQNSSSMSNDPVYKLQINVGVQDVPSHIPANQGSNIHPYIIILGSSPGTSVIEVTTDTTNRPTQDISSDAQSVRTNSSGFNSSTSSRIPYPQLTQTKITTSPLVDPLVDRARNCNLPVYQPNDNLPVAVSSSHFPSVQTRNPDFSSTPAEHPHPPITHTQNPHFRSANTHVPGIFLFSHTPEAQTRISGSPLTKTRNSVTRAVQTRSPGTSMAHTSSAGTMLGKMSPGTSAAHTSSAGTMLGKMSPGTSVAHTSSAGTMLGKMSPGTSAAHTSSAGTMLGKMSPGTSVAHTSSAGTMLGKMSPGTSVAHTSSAGIVLGKMSPGTSVAHTSSAGTMFGKMSPGTSGAHTSSAGTMLGKMSPGTSGAHTSSAGTMLGKMSPGTSVAHTSSADTMFGKMSPGTSGAHTSSAGTMLGKMSPGTSVAHTSSAGTMLGKMSPGTSVAHTSSAGTMLGKMSPGTSAAHTSSSGIVLSKTSPGTPAAYTHNSGTVLGKTRSPSNICFSQASSSGVSAVQARNSGLLFRAETPVGHVNPAARLPHEREHPSSRPERDWTDVVHQRDQTARLVVIPGDDNVNRYGLVFPSGAKVILTPEQVAEIRAANGGHLTSNFGR